MKNALILHGTKGSPKDNWFPWLKEELEKENYKVWLPQLPGSEEPKLTGYIKFILGNKNWKFSSESVIIGHSSGAITALALLNELPENTIIDTCILVAIFEKNSPGGAWEPNVSLFDYTFDSEKIKKQSKRFILFASDNDPYCPLSYINNLAKKLNGKLVMVKAAGHFNKDFGYAKFPLLLKYL